LSGMRKRTIASAGILPLLLLWIAACAMPDVKPAEEAAVQADWAAGLRITDVSEGLPVEGRFRQNVLLADINHDGLLDIVTPPPRLAEGDTLRPHVFLGDGKGGWTDVTQRMEYPADADFYYGSVGIGDFDEDGLTDMVLARHKKGLMYLKRTGEWTWAVDPTVFPTGEQFPTRTLRVKDMDGDGRLDLVAVGEIIEDGPYVRLLSMGLVVFKGFGTGKFRTRAMDGSTGLFADDLAIGDVSGNGLPDVAVGTLNSARRDLVWLHGAGLNFTGDSGRGFIEGYTAYTCITLADMDGDGLDDMVAGVMKMNSTLPDPNGLRIFYRRSEGWEKDRLGLPTDTRFAGVAAADLNGNGWKDIVALEYFTGAVRIFFRDPEGGFVEHAERLEPGGPAIGYHLTLEPLGEGRFMLATALSVSGTQGGGLKAYMIERAEETP